MSKASHDAGLSSIGAEICADLEEFRADLWKLHYDFIKRANIMCLIFFVGIVASDIVLLVANN